MKVPREQQLAEIQQWVNTKRLQLITTDTIAQPLLQRRNAALAEIQQMLDVIPIKSNEDSNRHARRCDTVINAYHRLRVEIIHLETIIGD